ARQGTEQLQRFKPLERVDGFSVVGDAGSVSKDALPRFSLVRGLVSRRAAGYPSESTDYRASWAGAHAAGTRGRVREERGGLSPGHDGGVLSPCDYAGAGVFDEQ
ncbi:hypothetical protein CSPX01_16960, partial [Colletotrichum filicis]